MEASEQNSNKIEENKENEVDSKNDKEKSDEDKNSRDENDNKKKIYRHNSTDSLFEDVENYNDYFMDEFGYIEPNILKKYKHMQGKLCVLTFTKHPSLGVGLDLTGPKNVMSKKTFVYNIYPGTPADGSSLQVGDQIVEVNGVSFENVDFTCAAWAILMMKQKQVKLIYLRTNSYCAHQEMLPKDRQVFTKSMMYEPFALQYVENLCLIKDNDFMGFTVDEDYDIYLGWVTKIASVTRNSPASAAHLKPGLIIVTINTEKILLFSCEEIKIILEAASTVVDIGVIGPQYVRFIVEEMRYKEWRKKVALMDNPESYTRPRQNYLQVRDGRLLRESVPMDVGTAQDLTVSTSDTNNRNNSPNDIDSLLEDAPMTSELENGEDIDVDSDDCMYYEDDEEDDEYFF